uniref:Uncharacterized protein n=1 Tax=Biomphalaria glabrata TaxID=6526 RepID=A0A2C9KKW7_BIOGL
MEKPLINSLVLLLQVAFCQHIQLSNYYGNQNCTIINELDRILLHGKLCFLNVPADCGDNRINYCQCFKTSDQAVYKVVINITAYKANSEADVRAELLYRETSFYSEIRKLPKVYDTETDSVQLYANDQAIDKFNSNVTTNDTRMTIFSKCVDSLANQCTLQLINLVNNSTVKAGLNVLAHNLEVKVDVKLELRYFICNQEKSISFSISIETTTYAQKMDNVGSRNKQNDQDQKVFRILICKGVLSVCYEDTNLRSLFETMLLLSCEIRIVGNTYGESYVIGVVDIVKRYCQSFGINTVQRNEHSYCTCNKCADSNKPSDSFAEIFIKTAHVFLIGKANKRAASCVFYHGAKTTTISALTISENNETALLKCVTCDQNLINTIECSVRKRNELQTKVQEKFRAFENDGKIQFSVKIYLAAYILRQVQAKRAMKKRITDLIEMLPLRIVISGW